MTNSWFIRPNLQTVYQIIFRRHIMRVILRAEGIFPRREPYRNKFRARDAQSNTTSCA